MKKQKGITLVALIITIIVMVILAGVIISSAVADGGIIDRAESAMKEKERAEAEELVIASYVYKTTASTSTIAVLDLDATADAIYENLTANGFTIIGVNSGDELYTGGDEIDLNIQGKQGNYTGTVTEKGLEDALKVEDDVNVGDTSDTSGKNEESLLPEGLTVGSEFEMDADGDGTNETWIVLYDETANHLNENEIEVISKNTMGNKLTLGKTDTNAIENATDIDGNGAIEELDFAIYSYNNAIDRINNYCNTLIKIENLGVRSVGSLPSNPSYINTEPFEITTWDKWNDTTTWENYRNFR